MPDTKLRVINQSNDRNNVEIVIFQKNEPSYDETAVAWVVIQHLGQGWNHPLTVPEEMFVAARDNYGNFSLQKSAYYGQEFQVKLEPSGDSLEYSGPASSEQVVEVLNNLQHGSIDALVYKSGRLVGVRSGIAPGQKAAFQFKPSIWVGVASQVEEGNVLNSAILSQINTEISLFGIASADIVMTGGGPGPEAKPFAFTLENVVYA